MATNEPELGPGLGSRKPRSELRHWSTYTSVGKWYTDSRGYVPIEQAAALDRLTRDGAMSFRDAYRLLLRRGTPATSATTRSRRRRRPRS